MKYTFIYQDFDQIGSHRNSFVRFKRVEVKDAKELTALVREYDGAITYIFEGWPKLEGEKDEPSAN